MGMKMDIVDHVEKVLGSPLLECQKDFVRKVYDAGKNGKRLYYIPPRGTPPFRLELLQAIVLITIGKEEGLVKGEWNDK